MVVANRLKFNHNYALMTESLRASRGVRGSRWPWTATAVCTLALSCSGPQGNDAGAGDGQVTDQPDPSVDGAVIADTGIDPNRIGPAGGAVDRLHFGLYGDVRPPNENETNAYPTMVFGRVIAGLAAQNPQFVVATGDYMYANTAATVNAQLDLFLATERRYTGYIFHALGNHECTGATRFNCPNGNETNNIRLYRERVIPDLSGLYYDFTIRTSTGAAHFIVTAPNAWSSSQDAWFDRMLATQAMYTFVVAHVPPTAADDAPGTNIIEMKTAARPGGVTLRLYGHTHDFRRIQVNGVIAGNAGAPLNAMNATYGFAMIDQRADGAIQVTEYEAGGMPVPMSTFAVRANGTAMP